MRCLLALLSCLAGCGATSADAESQRPLTREERARIRPHMTAHAQYTASLYEANASGDMIEFGHAAGLIARRAPFDPEGLPPLFIELDGILRDQAQAIEDAVLVSEPDKARAAFRALGRTCDRCHQNWFAPPKG